VGHVPLGHTLEDEFEGLYEPHDSFKSPRLPEIWWQDRQTESSEIYRVFHGPNTQLPPEFEELGISGAEAYSAVLCICLHKEKVLATPDGTTRKTFRQSLTDSLSDTGKHALLPAERRFVQYVLERLEAAKNIFLPYMADVVANTICADFMDYIRRDTANTGLDRQTDDRVLSQFYVGEDIRCPEPSSFRMALNLQDSSDKPKLDSCTGVVDLVRKRFRLAEIIYYHKTKVAASAMLAKALSLVGVPSEVPEWRTPGIKLADIEELTAAISSGRVELPKLRARESASALLSPEIGDDSLLLWLQERAWDDCERLAPKARDGGSRSKPSAPQRDREQVIDENGKITLHERLRGIALLQLLTRRRLYKSFAHIDAETVAGINSIDPNLEEMIESAIQLALVLRGKEARDLQRRADIEREMTAAAGWPVDAVIIYIPPRKSQAKGIETRALSSGHLLTLGDHPAVKDAVKNLNEQYKHLWRIILLVHPDYAHDARGLSRAYDVFVNRVWNVNPSVARNEALRRNARFSYIAPELADSAKTFEQLMGKGQPNWRRFLEAEHSIPGSTLASDDHAMRAYLMAVDPDPESLKHLMHQEYGKPGELPKRVEQRLGKQFAAGREGETQIDELRIALDGELRMLRGQAKV
jgi:hypothetical protein